MGQNKRGRPAAPLSRKGLSKEVVFDAKMGGGVSGGGNPKLKSREGLHILKELKDNQESWKTANSPSWTLVASDICIS